jgi:hypothetical protein
MSRRLLLAAPTFLEYIMVRAMFPYVHVVRMGVGLTRWKEPAEGEPVVVVCGLVGALDAELEPGTIMIPERLGLPNGQLFASDAEVTSALTTAARNLGYRVHGGLLLTASSLIVGQERHAWAHRGFVAVDMEAALLAARGYRVATVRVVLDGPKHELSDAWRQPATAMLQPRLWTELFWLGCAAPQYALRAARVLKAGLHTLPSTTRI